MGLCLSCKTTNATIKDKPGVCGDLDPRFVVSEESYCNVNIVTSEGNPSMANSFNNMNNITNPIKELVSKKRNRYIQDGYNLDLTYITQQIIAMGYPASKIEGVYRNHIDDVAKMLESKHKDHYMIYNLCSERSYDASKFHSRVQIYPFDDHNPPKIDLIEPFCKDVQTWLNKNEKNVAAVHCKAGKGRTGTMICCYLLHSGIYQSADDALNYYGKKRTQDRKGVTIPSQVRYVKYYGRIVKERLTYKPVNLYIYEIIIAPPPTFTGGQGGVYFAIYENLNSSDGKCRKLHKTAVYEVKKGGTNMCIKFDACMPITGDIKVELYSKSKISKVKQFQFWFNTFFVQEHLCDGDGNGFIDQNGGIKNSNDKPLVLTLNKSELDIVSKKDKQNKTFSSDFKITLLLHKVPEKSGGFLSPSKGGSSPVAQDSPSGSSEGDTSDDEEYEGSEWDSGESTVL